MSKKSIILSAAGLKNVLKKEEEEFVFIIGEKEIKMNKIQAEFISPTVSHIHQCDPTIQYLNINKYFKNVKQHDKENTIIDEITSEHIISTLTNISNGQRIEIENDEDIKRLRYLSILIHNEELFSELNKFGEEEYFSYKEEEIIEEINFLHELKNINIEEISSKLIDEISTLISKDQGNLMTKVINQFPKDILYLILHNEHFQYEDYDTLFDIINKIFSTEYNKDNNDNNDCDDNEDEYDINSFYEIIKINELSSNKYSEFIDHLKYNEITSEIWKQLIEILHEHHSKNKLMKSVEQEHFIDITNSEKNNSGIFNFLKEKSNIKEEIEISSSSINDGNLNDIIEIENQNSFYTNDQPDSWICIEFKNHKIIPTKYILKSHSQDSANCKPKSWIIEGSNDKENWHKLDEQNNCSYLNGPYYHHAFSIDYSKEEGIKFIRIRQTGKNWCNTDHLVLCTIELFGKLI